MVVVSLARPGSSAVVNPNVPQPVGLLSTPTTAGQAAMVLRRKPQRVTTTINWQLYQRLQERADIEGRSLSNLMAHLLEVATAVP